MENITINISIDEGNDLTLTFDYGVEIMIETAEDINLSKFVKELTFLIDKQPRLILNQLELEDPKLNLIQKTIGDITTSFNEIFDEEE